MDVPYYSSIPTKLDRASMTEKEWVKARTHELYDMLPLTSEEERKARTDIRDEIIQLNYKYFAYIAKNKYIADPNVTFEDKLQTALLVFCRLWWQYKFTPKFRADLTFSVFFKPRLGECMARELNPIKYSLRRSVCIKAAEQVGKHWGKLTREDIKNVKLLPNEMQILEAVFNGQYSKDIDLPDNKALTRDTSVGRVDTIEEIYTEDYDDVEDLIVHEMIETEQKLDDGYLMKMSNMYGVPFDDLVKARPIGEYKLKKQLEDAIFVSNSFEAASYIGVDSGVEGGDED